MMQILFALWVSNRRVHGAHEPWKAVRRAGHDVGRGQKDRLCRLGEKSGTPAAAICAWFQFSCDQSPRSARACDSTMSNPGISVCLTAIIRCPFSPMAFPGRPWSLR